MNPYGSAPLNLNTASAEAISASIPGLELGDARRMVTERERRPFRTLAPHAPTSFHALLAGFSL